LARALFAVTANMSATGRDAAQDGGTTRFVADLSERSERPDRERVQMAEHRLWFAAPRRPWVTPFAWTVLRAIWRERAGGSVSFAGCAREDVFCLPVVDVSSAFSDETSLHYL
jgi:hypothetical protein